MTLSIFQDEELVEALGYSSAVGSYWAHNDGLELLTGADAKRAWRAVPANWQRELERDRARRGKVSREEHLAKLRAHAADPAVVEAQRARRRARARAYNARPEVRERNRAKCEARRDAMTLEARRERWRLDTQAYRDRKRAERERGAS